MSRILPDLQYYISILSINPCPATPLYIWFKHISNQIICYRYGCYFCGRLPFSQIMQFRKFLRNIFHHLKLKIALAIPALNNEKYDRNNSTGQGVNFIICTYQIMYDIVILYYPI